MAKRAASCNTTANGMMKGKTSRRGLIAIHQDEVSSIAIVQRKALEKKGEEQRG